MGKLFVLIGKSASGKDFLMSQILIDCPHIKRLASYTTRPPRKGEENGREYFFVSDSFFEEKRREGKVVEERVKKTLKGEARYGTIAEGENFVGSSYIAIKDPEGAERLKEYYGEDNVVIILVTVDDGIRLMRAITREMSQQVPQYAELCERFLSDEEDFKEVKPDFIIENKDAMEAVQKLKGIIRENRKKQP